MYIVGLSRGLEAVALAIDEALFPHMRIAFVPTAGGTYEDPYFVEDSRKRLRLLGLTLVELDFAVATLDEASQILDDVDGVFVAGGNSFYLLKSMKTTGADSLLRDLVLAGLPYFGESAGAVVLYNSIEIAREIDDPEDVPGFTDYTALGLLGFFVLPHVDREKYRELFDSFYEAHRATHEIVRIRDDQAVITRDGQSYEIVDSRIADIT